MAAQTEIDETAREDPINAKKDNSACLSRIQVSGQLRRFATKRRIESGRETVRGTANG
jgi:hypothetical protein